MKKLYNKALMFQAFHVGKWALLLCCFFYGFVCYEGISGNLSNLQNRVSYLDGNEYIVYNYDSRLVCWALLVLLYIIITGLSKRNHMMFLTSGPYTKSEIKRNEILFLFICLCAFLAVQAYISLCLYYREIALIDISYNFVRETLKELIKLFICGIAFISYLSIMDSLFANIGITAFLMISTPFIIAIDLGLFERSLNILECNVIYNNPVGNFIAKGMRHVESFAFSSINYDGYNTYLVILSILIGTIALLILTKYTVKKLAINKTNKCFNFPIVEKIFVWCCSISITIAIIYFVLNSYTYRYRATYTEAATFSINGLIYIAVVCIASYILKRIINKQIKRLI